MFCISSEIRMMKKVMLKNSWVFGRLVISGNIVRMIGIVLCRLI